MRKDAFSMKHKDQNRYKLAPNVMFENAKLPPNDLFVHILAPFLGAPNVVSAPFNIFAPQNKRQ
jgi:hypothetical protein